MASFENRGKKAICAMNVGRAAANEQGLLERQQLVDLERQQLRQQLQPPPVPVGQARITQFLQPAPLTAQQLQHNATVQQHRRQQRDQLEQQQRAARARRLADVKAAARARFWELLVDFVELKVAPEWWLEQVPAEHPFLCVEGRQGQEQPGYVRLNRRNAAS